MDYRSRLHVIVEKNRRIQGRNCRSSFPWAYVSRKQGEVECELVEIFRNIGKWKMGFLSWSLAQKYISPFNNKYSVFLNLIIIVIDIILGKSLVQQTA